MLSATRQRHHNAPLLGAQVWLKPLEICEFSAARTCVRDNSGGEPRRISILWVSVLVRLPHTWVIPADVVQVGCNQILLIQMVCDGVCRPRFPRLQRPIPGIPSLVEPERQLHRSLQGSARPGLGWILQAPGPPRKPPVTDSSCPVQ